MYTFLKFIHVLAATIWVGGMFTLIVLNARIAKERQPAVTGVLLKHGQFVGGAVLGSSSGVLLLSGIALVLSGHLSFGALWITWGFIAFILNNVVRLVFVRPRVAELQQMSSSGGAVDTARVATLQKQIGTFTVFNLIVLVSAIWAMVAKI